MSYGSIYPVSWFGNVNDSGGWGAIYPFDADGSTLSADSTKVTSDSTAITADQTIF
jgi:hypothetical protein